MSHHFPYLQIYFPLTCIWYPFPFSLTGMYFLFYFTLILFLLYLPHILISYAPLLPPPLLHILPIFLILALFSPTSCKPSHLLYFILLLYSLVYFSDSLYFLILYSYLLLVLSSSSVILSSNC